ncbi:MAG: CinA family protein [Acholeplasma sp.]|nr:CinA family protein [Acholeplasma sp.]
MNAVEKVLSLLIEYDYKIAFAESVTGGGLSHELIKYPGASNALAYSVVTYSKEAKRDFLKINETLFDVHGVVSKVISMEMANQIKNISKADIGVGITGNAGPTAQANSNVGEMWFSIAYQGETYSYHIQFKEESREIVIDNAIKAVYQMLYKLLTK